MNVSFATLTDLVFINLLSTNRWIKVLNYESTKQCSSQT